jgi:type IV pilus assembly protein PilW
MHLYQSVNYLRSKGYSLVEFMVAITISLIIMLAVAIAWQSGFKTQQSQSDISRLSETIRFATDLLSREIRQAGLINKTTANPSLSEPSFCYSTNVGSTIVGVDDPANINPAGAVTTIPPKLPAGATQVLNKSDAIRVRYYGEDPNAGTMGISTTVTQDCLGYPVSAGTLVEDTLYVAADPNNNNEPALWCHTSNPNAAANPALALVAGVESLQLLYGEDMLPLDGIIDRYVPWQLVSIPDNIMSIKVSIVARSPTNLVSVDTMAKTFYHFGGATAGVAGSIGSTAAYTDPKGAGAGTTFIAPIDKRLRLPPMSTEIALRNFPNCLLLN